MSTSGTHRVARASVTLALLALFGQSYIGLAALEAAAIHVECPEHGELIHASSARATSDEARGYAPVSSNDEESEHEHCFVQLAPSERAAPSSTSFESSLCFASHRAPIVTIRGDAVLSRAPKTSPPV